METDAVGARRERSMPEHDEAAVGGASRPRFREAALRMTSAAAPDAALLDSIADGLSALQARLRDAAAAEPVDTGAARAAGAVLASGDRPSAALDETALDEIVAALASAPPGVDVRRWTVATAHAVAGFIHTVDGLGHSAAPADRRPDADPRHAEIADALRTATTDGSLALYYQPIIVPATGELVAFEALLRWRHGGALRNPSYFMEIAEQSHPLITDIGRWVIEQAIADMAHHMVVHPDSDVTVSVNVSPRQSAGIGLADFVAGTLAAYGVPASKLWIELTETALVIDTADTQQALAALQTLGVRLCLDDFGTGYSALSDLSTYPIGIVKIDRLFIADFPAGAAPERRRHDVGASIQTMASELGLATVAEGVETEAAHRRVVALGCDYAQGWWYARPMHVDDACAFGHTIDLARPRPPARSED